jgi:folate-dependent phosphoribosylglycinamide formyltransferase PurN
MLKRDHPLRVAILSSRRAPGAGALLASPHHGSAFEVVGALTSDEEFRDAATLEGAGVPVIAHPIRPFYRKRGAGLTDMAVRRDYDRRTVHLLAILKPELLFLSSYLYILTEPVLQALPDRIVNVHGSDLAERDSSGLPRYTGLRAVADAILAGERETRATAHWVTDEVDRGTPILRSRPFPVSPLTQSARARGDERMLEAYTFAHQEWMLYEAWGPLLAGVARLVATGRIAFGGRPAANGTRFPLWEISEQGGLRISDHAARPLGVN